MHFKGKGFTHLEYYCPNLSAGANLSLIGEEIVKKFIALLLVNGNIDQQ